MYNSCASCKLELLGGCARARNSMRETHINFLLHNFGSLKKVSSKYQKTIKMVYDSLIVRIRMCFIFHIFAK